MEQVLGSHGAFALGLLGLCGGIIGLKAGLWAVVLLYIICAVGVISLWFWENWGWSKFSVRGTPGAVIVSRSVLPARKGIGKNGPANI